MGTAYLFTEEAVATGAIVPGFQDEALALPPDRAAGDRARATRSASARRRSPDRFEAERQRLLAEGQAGRGDPRRRWSG